MEEKKKEERVIQKNSKNSWVVLVLLLALFAGGYYYYYNVILEKPSEDSPYIGTYYINIDDRLIQEGITLEDDYDGQTETITLNKDGTGRKDVSNNTYGAFSVKFRWAETEYGFKTICDSPPNYCYVNIDDHFYELMIDNCNDLNLITSEEDIPQKIEEIRNSLNDENGSFWTYFTKTEVE